MTLIGWWPLHDGKNGKARDYSGNGNHGTLNGGVTTGVAGRGGLQAASFDGTDDYVTFPYSTNLSAFTVSVWVRENSVDTDQRRAMTVYNNNRIILGRASGETGTISAYVDGWFGGASVSNGEWYLATVTYDGSTAKFYKNATLVASKSTDYSETAPTGNSIGASAGGESNVDATIFGARLYDRALSDSEIQTLYEWGSMDLARPPTDGVARYALDGDATDSWNNKDGTTNGGVSWSNNAIRGQAASFDGIDNYLNLGNIKPSAITVSLWVKASAQDNNGIISKRDGTNAASWTLRTENDSPTNDGVRLFVRDTSGSRVADLFVPDVLNDTWAHIVFTYSASEGAKIYVNSKPEDSAGATGNELRQTDSVIEAGHYKGGVDGDKLSGNVDDVRIYDRVLSPSEVHRLYRWGTRGKDMRKHLVNRRQK